MPLNFLASKDLLSDYFTVLDARKVGAVVKSVIPAEKCNLPVLAAADVPAVQPSFCLPNTAGQISEFNPHIPLSPQNPPMSFPRLIMQDLKKVFFLSKAV